MRTFLGIELPDQIINTVRQKGIQPLKLALPDGLVRWTPPENMHVTLKFIGETERHEVSKITETVEGCCRAASRYELVIGGLGAFPSPSRPRVLWAGATDMEGMTRRLHACIEVGLASLGFSLEKRALHLHVTMGRVRRRARSSALRQVRTALAGTEAGEFGRMRVDQLTLFESQLRPSGAQYSVLARFSLEPG